MPHYWVDVAFSTGTGQVLTVERLPWRPIQGSAQDPPAVGSWVRVQTFTAKRSIHVSLLVTCDLGVCAAVIPTDEQPDGRAQGAKVKPVAVYEEADADMVQRYKAEVQLINDDMNELIRDAMAGRFENSPRFSNFLRDVPDSVRQMLTASLENITAWLRASTEKKIISNWRRMCRPVLLVVPNEAARLEKRELLDRFLFPLLRFFNLPAERLLVHGLGRSPEEDCLEWERFPPGVSITTCGRVGGKRFFRWVSGKTISRRGVVDASPEYDGIFNNGLPAIMGGGAGRQEQQQQQQQQQQRQSNAPSSRAEAMMRQVAEFSGAERRMMFEQFHREFGGGGGGEMERRRERSGPPPAAGSAASLLIPPPLVVGVDGVVVPPPPGINPLVFPPPMNIS